MGVARHSVTGGYRYACGRMEATTNQCDWFLSVKTACVGVAMTKPHAHIVSNAHQVLGQHITNFSLIGPSVSFWQPK